MAVPTIDSVSPDTGPATGGHLIEITGTNFQLPVLPDPLPVGPVPEPPSTVRVLFDGVAADEVHVVANDRLFVRTPKWEMVTAGGKPIVGPVVVDVTVQNIDDDGNLIGAEAATAAGAYTYARVSIDSENIGILATVVRELLRLLKSEIIGNVSISTHTDYDSDSDDGLQIIDPGELPAVVLGGPGLEENRFKTVLQNVHVSEGAYFKTYKPAKLYDLVFDLYAITKHQLELLNLIELIDIVLDNNTHLTVDGHDYELFYEAPSVKPQPAQYHSNIRLAQGRLIIEAVPIIDLAGVEDFGAFDVGAPLDDDVTLLETELIPVEEE